MSLPKVLIRVVSDNVCPWCFVGKRNMEAAIKQFDGKLDFEVEFFPYSLHGNTMPEEGMDLSDYIFKVYGRRMNVNDPRSPLKEAGEKVGIKFDNTRTMVNTLDSHRLITFAKKYNKHLEMVEAIFKAYFENAVNISQLKNLEAIGAEVLGDSVTRDQVKEFLQGDECRQKVEEEIDNARANSVTGVPSFTLLDATTMKGHLLSGAQPPERFTHTFSSILNSAAAL
eukprot:CAMPEP_0117003150 /NCGR_PEP_ID=MMETSP0472-20121206/4558_1 /TAXON_ID=693140 ORGANISM="Tiarina fusus, Strain LIS" /NCGR_SAMPLE_ID=MMETSP0472 /ASSEMBLY_ACC=CAM_ASM_000603 /LENGTH=225 /DNA_ID=CAMNT_0004703687 /DNA_START=1 /DNA_END=678 /DNA_ORIENTATION=-